MSEIEKFNQECKERVSSHAKDDRLQESVKNFSNETLRVGYSYNFNWLGRPIIQYPQDMIALQEIIWDVKPDMIIETGIAHGGSLIFSASMLTLLEACGEIEDGKVLGIDIDIREHNRKAIEAHPMSKKITMYQGSSVDEKMIARVHEFAKKGKKIMVILDSNHTHEHVLSELRAYASLVSIGSYCCVFDTLIEDMPKGSFPDRPWDKGDNPKTAVWEYLKECNDFVIDKDIENKILITVAPDGYLRKRISTKIYYYKMIVDNGGAPCVQDELLSLAICKPRIRSTINIGDFIIGFGSNALDNKLIYIAQVTGKLLNGEYYKKQDYSYRDDCLYNFHEEQYSRRADKKYHICKNTPHDEGNDIVLLSNNYRYFGNKSNDDYTNKYPLMKEILENLKQGHKVNHDNDIFDILEKMIVDAFAQKQLDNVQPLHSDSDKSLNCSAIEDSLECVFYKCYK
jgi:cephalosporin hydroxylase